MGGLYLARPYEWNKPAALAGDGHNLLDPTAQRLVVEGEARSLVSGWWHIEGGVVWEIEWQDGRTARVPLHEDVLRRPNFFDSLDPTIVLGSANDEEEEGSTMEEIIWERSIQLFMFDEDRVDENQREVFNRTLDAFIDQMRGHVPLLTEISLADNLDRFIKNPLDIVSLHLEEVEGSSRLRKARLVMEPVDPSRAADLSAQWEALGSTAHWDEETGLLTIEGLVC